MIEKYVIFLGDRRRIPVSINNTALFYCLSGLYKMETDEGTVSLKEKELLTVNAGEKIGWEAEKGSLLFRVSIEESRLQRFLKQKKVRFLLNSPEHRTRDYHALQEILDNMIQQFPDKEGEFALWGLYYMLWEEMRKDFLFPSEEEPAEPDLSYHEITAEIYTRFHEPLTAKTMALRYGMSESAFSRWFQKKGGIRFSEYLRRTRLEYAREQLLESDISVADIAFQSGFSNLSVFNHSFRDYYHMTPRQMRRQAALIQLEEAAVDAETVQQYIAAQAERNQEKLPRLEKITVDAESGFPAVRNAADILGPIEAADLLEAKHQETVVSLSQSLSAQAVRIVHLFSDRFAADDDADSGNAKWCFDRMYLIFDFLIWNHLKPVIELSVPGNSGRKTTVQGQYSLSQWQETFCAFLKHMINRYTMESISEWNFEIRLCSPVPTGHDTVNPYDFYTASWNSITKYIADAKPGLGGINMTQEGSIPKKLTELWKKGEKKPSFLSVSCEPYTVSRTGDRKRLIADQHYVRDQLSLLHGFMEEANLTDTPVWITEWNTPFGRTSLYNDTCGRACHLLMQLSDAVQMADRISCGAPSDWTFLSAADTPAFFGGKGLISKDGIPKPCYHALQLFSFMGDTCLTSGDGYYATIRPDGYFSMLLYHPGTFSPAFHQHQADDITIETLSCLYEKQSFVDYLITFRNLKSGEYTVNSFEYRADQESPLSVWAQLGYKKSLNFGEIHYIKSISVPRISFLPEQVNDGTLILKYRLNINDFQLILLAPQA